jgi:hypothetical protein
MKNIKYLLPIVVFSLLSVSCSDFLDVRPENKILLDEMWQKESDVEAVLMACYRTMQEDDFMKRLVVWGELRSDNIMAGNSATNAEEKINDVNILSTNANCSWAAFYKVINYCNTILKYAPEVTGHDPDFTQSDLEVKLAEALSIRALCYFYLVRTFRDIPWVEEATISDDQNLEAPQSTPETVLATITADLLKAENWALATYPTTRESKGRMTKDAIRAILADVYLWQKNYSQCITYCDKLIDASIITTNRAGESSITAKYELIEENSSAEIFDDGNSSESIFELQFTSEKSNAAVSAFYGTSTSIGQMVATTAYAEGTLVFGEKDERKPDFIVSEKTGSGEYGIFKYLGNRMGYGTSGFYSYKQTTANWIFYRITDIMLLKAEALVQLNRSENDLKTALHIVNTTYMRANPTLLPADSLAFESYNNAPAMEKLVLLERQRELMFEGKRWYDLVRHCERKGNTNDLIGYVVNKYTENISTITVKLAVMNGLYLPIAESELKANPLLVQNPYYQSSSAIEKN